MSAARTEPDATSDVAHQLVQSWHHPDTRLAEVLEALGSLRQAGELGGTRAAVVNLVVLSAGDAAADRAVRSIVHLGAQHPGRIVVVVPGSRSAPGRLGARVDLYRSVVEGRPLWWDVVRLEAEGVPGAHLASLVEPLLLHDLPVSVWLAGGTTQVGSEPLARLADQVVVSGERAAQSAPADVAPDLEALARRRPLADLAWLAIEPARQALVRLFDPPERRQLLASPGGVQVDGPPWSARLLAGWLAERLSLDLARVRLAPAAELSARLELGDQTAWLRAGAVWPAGHGTGEEPAGSVPGSGPGAVEAGLGGHRVVVPHAGRRTPVLLALALSRPWRDRRYEAVLPVTGRLLV